MSYTSSPNGLFSYTISGTSDATEISVIQSAFDKWDSLLTVPDRFLDTGETKYTITVTYSVADLDTGILGSAALQTYRYVTSNTYGNMMPLTGFIQLNTDYTAAMLADVRTSGKTRYYYVVLHEIGHILGIGQFWSTSFSAPLSTYTEDSTTKYYYTGTNAVEQYKSYLTNPEKNLVLGIPVEDEGGTGTKNVHPEEGLETGVSTDDRYINGVFHPGLNTELMTGWMDGSPDDTPLSRITLGFLADQGYNVNYDDAESFSIIYTNMSYNFDTLRNSGQTDEQIQAAYPNALLDASLGYFNNANKFKESYVKDLLDVSGNMKVYPGYKTLVESSVEDGSHNIAGTLHTNTLNIDDNSNLTSNTLSVNGDVSFNKHVTIGGNLTVKGAFKLPDNSLEPTDFSDYDANSTSVGPNEFNFNNSNIFSALDLSGIDVYVAGDTTVNANDFKIEGNVYANSIINDEKDNPIIEDNTLINRLDLSNNPFKVKKTYTVANYAGILDKNHSGVPYISDTGKNMSFMNYNSDGTYNTAFSNNYGTSFVDMATRLGGTPGTSNTYGLLNFHVTDNQKYIYGIDPSRGIVKSTNYGHEFTDVSMISLPDSDLSFSILGASVFDLSHADTICSSSDGKHTYIGGIIPNSLNQVDYKLIKSSDYGNNFVFDISTNQISIIKQVDLSLNETSVRHLSCSSDGKYVVANIKGVTKANYLMNDLTGTSHPVLSTDYGNNWQLLNSHHFNEYQVLENLDLSFNQNKLKMDCLGLKISKTGRYIACALGSQELTNKMLFYLSSDYGKSFDFKSILNNDNTTSEKQINLSPNAEHIATFSTHQGRNVNISTDYGVNWKEVDLSLNGLSAPNSAQSYVSGNLQYLAHNSNIDTTLPGSASLGGVNITHDFDFREASTGIISDRVSLATMRFYNGAYSTTSNGLILDGTNDYAECDGFDVNFSGSASFEFYIKFNNTTASETIFSLHDSTSSDGFSLAYVYNQYVETGQFSGTTSIYRPLLTNAQGIGSYDFDPRYNHLNNWINGGSLTQLCDCI